MAIAVARALANVHGRDRNILLKPASNRVIKSEIYMLSPRTQHLGGLKEKKTIGTRYVLQERSLPISTITRQQTTHSSRTCLKGTLPVRRTTEVHNAAFVPLHLTVNQYEPRRSSAVVVDALLASQSNPDASSCVLNCQRAPRGLQLSPSL